MRLQVSVEQKLDEERFAADRAGERLVVRGDVRRQLRVGRETLATEQTAERPVDAEVMDAHVQVPLHLRVEHRRTAAAPVHLTLVAVLHREVNLNVHLRPLRTHHKLRCNHRLHNRMCDQNGFPG